MKQTTNIPEFPTNKMLPYNIAYKKYNNKTTVIDGIKFDSKAEAKHYSLLMAMKNSGLIKDFNRQVRFIIATVGKRTRSYIADFVVTMNDDSIEVQDVKGFKTPVYNLKKFLMEEKHGIKIIEITQFNNKQKADKHE